MVLNCFLNLVQLFRGVSNTILDKVVTIQKLPEEDKSHIMYSLDGLIQHAKRRLAYK